MYLYFLSCTTIRSESSIRELPVHEVSLLRLKLYSENRRGDIEMKSLKKRLFLETELFRTNAAFWEVPRDQLKRIFSGVFAEIK